MSLARPSSLAGASAPPCLLRSSSRGASHSGRVAVARRAGDKPADSSSEGGEKMGVIVVDHGSRRQASNLLLVGDECTLSSLNPLESAQILLLSSPSSFLFFRDSHLPPPTPREYFAQEEFVRMYREETGRPIVEIAHMEIAEPSIEVAFGRCVEQGATLVAVSPFFLSPGRHWQEVRATVSPGVIFSFYFV